jgi:2-C-methyl-D-erythritol 4-phosphate cytidylyltransferase
MNIALIVAAGTGSRMRSVGTPKQFLIVCDKPLFIHTVEKFESNHNIDYIVIITSKDYIEKVTLWCKDYKLTKVKRVVLGGDTRQASVYNGLLSLESLVVDDDDIILIHDAARPMVSCEIIDDNIEACRKYGAVSTVIKSSDTMIRSSGKEQIEKIENRDELFHNQTPQTFKYSIIKKAHDYAKNQLDFGATDDSQLVVKSGGKVYLVQGSKLNFKVTNDDDLKLFESILESKKY